jgi:hypothetical protein
VFLHLQITTDATQGARVATQVSHIAGLQMNGFTQSLANAVSPHGNNSFLMLIMYGYNYDHNLGLFMINLINFHVKFNPLKNG